MLGMLLHVLSWCLGWCLHRSLHATRPTAQPHRRSRLRLQRWRHGGPWGPGSTRRKGDCAGGHCTRAGQSGRARPLFATDGAGSAIRTGEDWAYDRGSGTQTGDRESRRGGIDACCVAWHTMHMQMHMHMHMHEARCVPLVPRSRVDPGPRLHTGRGDVHDGAPERGLVVRRATHDRAAALATRG